MLPLHEALAAIKPALETTTRFASVKAHIINDELFAYNGQIAARAKLDVAFGEPVIVDAARLLDVCEAGSKFSIAETFVTVVTRKTRYRLLRLPPNDFPFPTWPEQGAIVSEDARAALKLAAKFSSVNAQHPWACGVTLRNNFAVATNNVAAVSVECPLTIEGTLPFWAVQAILGSAAGTHISFIPEGIFITSPNGVQMRASLLDAPMPPKLFDLVTPLEQVATDVTPYRDLCEDVFKIGGRFCELTTGRIRVEGENGEEAEAAVPPIDHASLTLSAEIARLIFETTTHIGFDAAPQRLLFSKADAPRLAGVCAAAISRKV